MNEMELLTQMLERIPADASPARAEARVRTEISRVTGAPARTRNGAFRRTRLALAGGVAAAALTGALVAQAVEHTQAPAANSTYQTGSGARLAAWTVQRGQGGLLVVTIRELRDPSGLAALLRSHGVPARLEFPGYNFTPTTSLSVIPRSCKVPNMSNRANAELSAKILPPFPTWFFAWLHVRRTRFGPHTYEFRLPRGGASMLGSFAIRPSAIPAGIGLFIEAWAAQPGHPGTQLDRVTDLVLASPQCTG
jgi:hypothetical protein